MSEQHPLPNQPLPHRAHRQFDVKAKSLSARLSRLYGHHSRCTLRYFRVDVTDNPNERRTKKGATKNACPLFFILLFGTNADRTIRGSAQETILGGIGPNTCDSQRILLCGMRKSEAMFLFPRRDWLYHSGRGLGSIALMSMLADESFGTPGRDDGDSLSPKPTHHSPKAKRVIFLYMTGGVSHVDSFDPKPKLFANHGKQITVDNWQGRLGQFARYLKKPNWEFRPGGESGIEVSDLFPNIRQVVDHLCVIRSMETNHTNHYESTLGMHCGSWTFARPSLGAWVSYGLGTINKNLPSFVVIAPQAPYAGAQTWGSDFLPGCHQGTQFLPGAVNIGTHHF